MRSAIGIVSLIGLLALAGTGARTAAEDAGPLSGPEILARAGGAYAHCSSYRDAGVVRIEYLEGDWSRVEERPFRTAFVRPDRFRFEFEETTFLGKTRRYIVWRDGARVRTWWDLKPGIEERETLDSALAAATGVSGGSAHAIPVLLMPGDVSGRRLTDMTDVRRVADAEVGGAACVCVEGKYAGHPRTACFDKATLLVRWIAFETTFPKFTARETTTYEPVIDEPIATQLLEFGPPAR
jgi:hypothetical protein